MVNPGKAISLSLSSVLAATPTLARPARAAALGYTAVESWWPWKTATPPTNGFSDFVNSFSQAGTRLLLLNLAEGDPEFGGRGLAGIEAADHEFWRNAESALALASASGTRFLNALAGDDQGGSRERAHRVLTKRLVRLADAASGIGAVVVVEQLNRFDHPDYLLTDPHVAAEIVREAAQLSRAGNVQLLADLYHLGRAGVHLERFLTTNVSLIGHVQVADAPGRGRPGTGDLPIPEAIAALRAAGYDGSIGLEYLARAGDATPTVEQATEMLSGATIGPILER